MTEEGGFLTRSTPAPDPETVLTPELIEQMVKDIADSFGYRFSGEPHMIVSPEEMKMIKDGHHPYLEIDEKGYGKWKNLWSNTEK